MIRAIFGHGGGEAVFLDTAMVSMLPGVELASAWYALGKGQPRGANGWYFFTAGEDDPPFALALRRGTAWACGPHDPEELGEFLRAAGVSRLTAWYSGGDCPNGFAVAERMRGVARPYISAEWRRAEAWARADFPAGYRLTEERDAARIADFLRQEGMFDASAPVRPGTAGESGLPAAPNRPENETETAAERQIQQAAAQTFAQELDARAAIGLSYAAFLKQDGPVFGTNSDTPPAAAMVVTTAPHAKLVCLSALCVRADLRGQGLGRRMVYALAAEAARYARGLCLFCRPEHAVFYARLGFAPEGDYACFVPAP